LGAHFPGRNGAGELQKAIGERAFTVVDMGDNAKIADMRKQQEGFPLISGF